MKNKGNSKQPHEPFTFLAPLVTIEGNYVEHGIYLPEEIIAKLPTRRLRAKGTINGVAFALAVQYRKNGDRFFMVNKKLVKEARLAQSSKATVCFWLVDADVVDMPEELMAVIEQDHQAEKIWATFTNGLKRSLIHYITSAKSIDVRIKRSLELMDKAKRGVLITQKAKKDFT